MPTDISSGTAPTGASGLRRTGLQSLGLNPDEILKHGIRREVYAMPIATNARAFLSGADEESTFDYKTVDEISELARSRWLIPRARRRPGYRLFRREHLRDVLMQPTMKRWIVSDDNFNRYCEQLLVQYKRRNSNAVTRHLRGVCDILRHEDDHVVQTKFGGSVQKGTFVTGLSDVDVLLIVNQSSLKNNPPSKVIAYVRDTIKRNLPNNPVSAGKLAVTVSYADKSEIQVLPAIRTTGGFRIAEPGSRKWSNVVHSDRFADRLIEVNNACGGRVVPTIKLAKAMADCFIKDSSRKLSRVPHGVTRHRCLRRLRGETGPEVYAGALSQPLDQGSDDSNQGSHRTNGACRRIPGSRRNPNPAKGASTQFGQMRRKVISCRSRAEFNDLFCEGK